MPSRRRRFEPRPDFGDSTSDCLVLIMDTKRCIAEHVREMHLSVTYRHTFVYQFQEETREHLRVQFLQRRFIREKGEVWSSIPPLKTSFVPTSPT